MSWYDFVLVIIFLLYFLTKIRDISKQILPEQFLSVRTAQYQGFKRITFFPIRIPYLDGLYLFYVIRKYGMSAINHYLRNLQLDKVYEVDAGPFKLIASGDATISSTVVHSSDPEHLSRPKFLHIFSYIPKNGLLFTPYKVWTNQRKICSRAFTFRCIQSYSETIDLWSKDMVKEMKVALKESGGSIKGKRISDIIDNAVLKITLEFIMGSSPEIRDSKEAMEYSNDLLELKEISMYRFFHPECYVPIIWWLHPKQRRKLVLEKRMFAFVEKVIEHYKLKASKENEVIDSNNNAEKRCLVEEMIKHGASSTEIYHEIATFLVAGNETVTAVLNLLLHHFACHPVYQSRCRKEIDSVLGSKDSNAEHLDMDKLSKLEYLDMFICESLRITPAVPFTARELGSSLKLNENLTLKKGQILIISPWINHHNPKYYPQPDTFDPDRFLPEKVKERDPGTFIPFTAGYRNCIGRRLAMLELKTLVVSILRNFDIFTEDGLHDVKLNFEVTVSPEKPFRTILMMRNNN